MIVKDKHCIVQKDIQLSQTCPEGLINHNTQHRANSLYSFADEVKALSSIIIKGTDKPLGSALYRWKFRTKNLTFFFIKGNTLPIVRKPTSIPSTDNLF